MKTLSNELSRSFKYFYKQTKHKNNISLKSLRKRYITDMSQTMGAQTFAVTGHSEGSKVLDENYKDKSILVSIAASKFKLFQEEEKQQELEQIRNSKKSLDQTIEK